MQMKTPAQFHPLSPKLLKSCKESILERWPFTSGRSKAEFINSDIDQWGMICCPSSLDARIELVVISIAVLFLVDGKITHPIHHLDGTNPAEPNVSDELDDYSLEDVCTSDSLGNLLNSADICHCRDKDMRAPLKG